MYILAKGLASTLHVPIACTLILARCWLAGPGWYSNASATGRVTPHAMRMGVVLASQCGCLAPFRTALSYQYQVGAAAAVVVAVGGAAVVRGNMADLVCHNRYPHS